MHGRHSIIYNRRYELNGKRLRGGNVGQRLSAIPSSKTISAGGRAVSDKHPSVPRRNINKQLAGIYVRKRRGVWSFEWTLRWSLSVSPQATPSK